MVPLMECTFPSPNLSITVYSQCLKTNFMVYSQCLKTNLKVQHVPMLANVFVFSRNMKGAKLGEGEVFIGMKCFLV